MYERDGRTGFLVEDKYGEIRCHGYLSDDPKVMAAKLVDGYLSEIGRDPNLPLSDFVDLADMASSLPRSLHDGLYRAIDVYLKEHPHMSKTERKRICRLMDCKKLSREACTHAVQNDRLPLRVVVQALFFEQACRSSGGGSTPDLHRSIGSLLPAESNSSSRSATTTTINPEDDWDGSAATASTSSSAKPAADRVGGLNKARGSVVSKIFMKLRSMGDRNTEFSSSDTSESPGGSANVDDAKSAPSGGRHSVS